MSSCYLVLVFLVCSSETFVVPKNKLLKGAKSTLRTDYNAALFS